MYESFIGFVLLGILCAITENGAKENSIMKIMAGPMSAMCGSLAFIFFGLWLLG